MSAFVTAFSQLLQKSYTLGASDIHIEPLGDRLRVRLRVDGRLQTLREICDEEHRRRWLEVIKAQSQLDTGVLGVPQDVRFGTEEPPCDYRVALIPGMYGEKLVLRLLPRTVSFDLDAYRMPQLAKEHLRAALTKKDGLIVVSGPTGSGKTTLLYNALSSLDPDNNAIYTLEDPIEYRLPGLWQSQVDHERGVGFAQLLRALMRADPDVVLMGEIRDEETAEAALHAAKTGHLVLTTVHANDTAGIRARLVDLGVSAQEYDATVRFASAQRLLPRVCEVCREPDEEGRARLSAALGEVSSAFRGAGCEACGGLGTRGRVLLMGWQRRVVSPDGSSTLQVQQTLRTAARQAAGQGVVCATDAAGY